MERTAAGTRCADKNLWHEGSIVTDTKSKDGLTRRGMVALAPAAGVMVAAGAQAAPAPSPEPAAKPDHRKLHYEETDHVRRAYARMRT